MQLNENELEVLRLLWQRTPQKPTDLQADFGWDIDNGTLRSVLVGMVDADISLENGDPRAGERSWQLLSQVSGRAGQQRHRHKRKCSSEG